MLALIAAELSKKAEFGNMSLADQAAFVADLNLLFARSLNTLDILGASSRLVSRGNAARSSSFPTVFCPAPQKTVDGPGAAVHFVVLVEHGLGKGNVQINSLFTVGKQIAIYGDNIWLRVTVRGDGALYRVQFHPASTFKFNEQVLWDVEIQLLKKFTDDQRAAGTFWLPKLSRKKNKPSEVIILTGNIGASAKQHPELVNLYKYPVSIPPVPFGDVTR